MRCKVSTWWAKCKVKNIFCVTWKGRNAEKIVSASCWRWEKQCSVCMMKGHAETKKKSVALLAADFLLSI